MERERLLIVDDEEDLLEGLIRMLGLELPDLEIVGTRDGHEALRIAADHPVDLVLTDIRMPEIDGLDLLDALKRSDPWLTVILMTGYGTIETAVEAMKRGAYDFVTKPFDMAALVRSLGKGLERSRLIMENRALKERVGETSGFEGFVGQTPPMRRLYEILQAASRTDYPVLIQGPSGTGKELAARAIHALGRRGRKPLFTVNCPAIPEHLLESELFGHNRGAFTGADRDQTGIFKEADGGTLFLDEVADVPISVQTKLLRVLQEGEIKPLGGGRTLHVDVRVIAATNRDLGEMIRNREFRDDLYYRLNVVPVRTPGLIELREDIPLLADHFARQASRELDLTPRRLSFGAQEALCRKEWPGNVRELQNTIRRLVMFSRDDVISAAEVNALEGRESAHSAPEVGNARQSDGVQPYKEAKEGMIEEFTRTYVTDLLEQSGGNVTRAAELSGLGRASLQKIMRRMDIRSDDFKSD